MGERVVLQQLFSFLEVVVDTVHVRSLGTREEKIKLRKNQRQKNVNVKHDVYKVQNMSM